MIRRNRLHLISYMRSNDVYLGLPHDVFCFTMIQEVMARVLSLEIGTYKHMVGSLHLYDAHVEKAELFLSEGWQATTSPMPEMPAQDPREDIRLLLEAESLIRDGQELDPRFLEAANPYWADLVRLLLVFRFSREKVRQVRDTMVSSTYNPYIDKMMGQER